MGVPCVEARKLDRIDYTGNGRQGEHVTLFFFYITALGN